MFRLPFTLYYFYVGTIILVWCTFSSSMLFAANEHSMPGAAGFHSSNKEPLTFLANNIEYNVKLGLIIATGNVIITQGAQIVKADKVYIEKDKNVIIAKGNVYYKNETGQQIFGDYIEITDNMNNMIINHISLLYPDNSLLTAKKVVKNGDINNVYNAAYTTCPFGQYIAPFWSIRASKVSYNTKNKLLTIYSGWFQIKDVPILWLPYAYYTDPTAKRKAGLLFPQIGSISTLGAYITLPVFFPLNNYTDLTIAPSFFQKVNPMVQAAFSQNIPGGNYSLQGSYTRNHSIDPTNHDNWHFFSYARKNLTATSRVTIAFNDASSRTYLALYPLAYNQATPFFNQQVSVEFFPSDQDYLKIQAIGSKSTNFRVDRHFNPYILPQITYTHFGRPTAFGTVNMNLQYSNFLTNSLSPNDNPDVNKTNFDFNILSTIISHEYVKPTYWGIFSINSSLQNVNYYQARTNNIDTGYSFAPTFIDNNIFNVQSISNKNVYDGYTGGNISAKVEYPITASIEDYVNIFDPIIQLSSSRVLLTKHHSLHYLDPNNLNINVLSLFENNKYNGFDYYENAQRFNYGLLWNLISSKGFNGKMIVGQSVNLTQNFKSDYLLYLGAAPSPYFNVSYEGAINPKSEKIEQSNFSMFLGNNLAGFNLTYALRNNEYATIYGVSALESVTPSVYIKIAKGLQFNGSATFDLHNTYVTDFSGVKKLSSFNSALMWQNDCFSIAIGVNRSYYDGNINNINSNLDIRPNNSYTLTFVLKGLGTLNLGENLIDKANNINSNIQN